MNFFNWRKCLITRHLEESEPKHQNYRIELDRKWKLEDFSHYTRNYEQAYFAFFALASIIEASTTDEALLRKVSQNLQSYPWMGGHSVVAFYTGVKRIIGRRNVPEIKEIKFASPGFVDLYMQLPPATQLAASVASIAGSIGIVNKVYNDIYRGMRDRELNKIEVDKAKLSLTEDNIKFLEDSCRSLGLHLKVEDVYRLIEISGNELRALKVLQSMFRRVRVLANYQNDKKAFLPLHPNSEDEKKEDEFP